jgi:hypothetical protein
MTPVMVSGMYSASRGHLDHFGFSLLLLPHAPNIKMSFGFSVGDFIAVGKLINDISSCLQDAGGAKAEYQELMHE